ncbi:hypothetical protein ACFLVW_00210 [Chloroflexota bacterium]
MKNLDYEVVWPRAMRRLESLRCARRLDTLEGKTVGELWDWIFHGDKVFPMIEKELVKRYPGIKFVSYEVFGSTTGAQETENINAFPDKFKEHNCDAIISGIGC